jgi:hypothetical protein
MGLTPITISGIETCPEGPAAGKLQKGKEYDLRIGFTTSTTDLEELRVYYCLTATASSPLPVGSGACKSGTSICPMTNQVACPSGECNPENCSGVAACICDAKIKIPWAVQTAGIVITGKSLGVEQNTANPQNYEVIAPIEQPIEGVLETQLLVYGGYQTFRCENIAPGRFPGCGYDFSCNGAVTDTNPIVSCKDCNDCKVACAQACGESTTCIATASATCEACCDSTTCGKGTYGAYDFWNCLLVPCYNSVQESCACKQACRGECEANTSFCNTIELLRLIAGIAAAIMLVIQALRYVMSDEPMDRQNAKEGIWYVLIGALLIMIASALVGYFFMEGLPC